MNDGVHILPDAAGFPYAIDVADEAATRALGARVAALLRGNEIILLNGDLGMGKTCFVQGLCAELKVHEEVVSPTFTLVNTYVGRLTVHHLDFYRVEAGHDLADIGVPDILDAAWNGQAVVLVEWPGPLVGELGNAPYFELLATPGAGLTDRTWHLRGGEVPAAWRQIFTRKGPPQC